MKKLFTLLVILFGVACEPIPPILDKAEYEIMDTVYVDRNNFGVIEEYDIILKYDSAYYYGTITKKGDLKYMNPRKLKYKK